jgi:tRNA nucleotidyltransferase (CCA-adding enzyme)
VLIVGGSVRDGLLGRPYRDRDVEVLGLTLDELNAHLAHFGRPIRMGKSFESLRLPGLDVDFAVAGTPDLDFPDAARRRDLTVNAMGLDPLSQAILDPHGGRRDLAEGVLRATDPDRFGDDPLRALRVARLAAELEMRPDPELTALCSAQDLSAVASERIFDELRKLLLGAARPAAAFRFLAQADLLGHFPELDALRGVPQDPRWHPEGDVWIHTLMVVDEAAALRCGDPDDLALMFGALCHDMGKPERTQRDGERIRSRGHEARGIEMARAFLETMRAPTRLVNQVAALVEHHLAPALYPRNAAGPRGYRRLARKLQAAHVSIELLARVARADQLGRTTEQARARVFPDGERFLADARALGVASGAEADVVQGRHLLARGIEPGPGFAEILARCRAVQEESGETDPERILDRVL